MCISTSQETHEFSFQMNPQPAVARVNGQMPDFKKLSIAYGQRMKMDSHFRFLFNKQLPVMSSAGMNDVTYLIYAGEYSAAQSIALDFYCVYRLQIMDYITELKAKTLTLGDTERNKMKVVVFDGLVLDIFYQAMVDLTRYHEGIIKMLTDFFYQHSRNHPQPQQLSTKISAKVMADARSYTGQMRKMLNAIRTSLSMIYALHMNGN